MLSRLRLPSPAMVVALIALFVALGGTATSASFLITSRDIKDGAIRGRDIRDRTIPHTKLREGKGSGLNADKVHGRDLAQIAAIPGPANSAAALLARRTADFTVQPGLTGELVSSCAPGERVTGGGYASFGAVVAFDSRPNTDASWAVFAQNLGGLPVSVTVWAICMR